MSFVTFTTHDFSEDPSFYTQEAPLATNWSTTTCSTFNASQDGLGDQVPVTTDHTDGYMVTYEEAMTPHDETDGVEFIFCKPQRHEHQQTEDTEETEETEDTEDTEEENSIQSPEDQEDEYDEEEIGRAHV